MKLLTTLFLLLLTSSQILAEEVINEKPLKQYDVEIIIFEDAHARYINSELWPKPEVQAEIAEENIATDTSDESLKNLDQLSLKEINETSYKNMSPKILKTEYKRINHSSEYNVLQYSAWRQTGLDKNKAFEIDINNLDNAHKTNTTKSRNTISGQLKLVLARYLHIYGELDYQRAIEKSSDENTQAMETVANIKTEVEPQGTENTSLITEYESYPIKFHRKMRSKKLHYIDHPLVGILIQINPVKLPEKSATDKPK